MRITGVCACVGRELMEQRCEVMEKVTIVENKENLAQTSASQGPLRLPDLHHLLKTCRSLHARQLQRQHWCLCLCVDTEKTGGDEKSSLRRRGSHVGGKGWELTASATGRLPLPFWCHPATTSLTARVCRVFSLTACWRAAPTIPACPCGCQGVSSSGLGSFCPLLVYAEDLTSIDSELLWKLQLSYHARFKGCDSLLQWGLRGAMGRASTCPGRASLGSVHREADDFLPSLWLTSPNLALRDLSVSRWEDLQIPSFSCSTSFLWLKTKKVHTCPLHHAVIDLPSFGTRAHYKSLQA